MAARPHTISAVKVKKTSQWKWQVTAPNGAVVVESAKKFTSKFAAERSAETMAGIKLKFVPLPRENAS